MNREARHYIFPPGTFVFKGFINRKEYFIILNYESYATFLPRYLKKESEFDLHFYEEEINEQGDIVCLHTNEYLIDTNIRQEHFKSSSFTSQERMNVRNCFKSTIKFDVNKNNIFIKNGIEYEIIFDSPNDNIIMLGRNSLKYLSVFIDFEKKTAIISNSFHQFNNTIFNYCSVGLFVSFIVVWWLLVADLDKISMIQNRKRKARFILILLLIQIFNSIFSLLIIFLLTFVYRIERYIRHYLETEHEKWILYPIIVMCCLMAMSNLIVNFAFLMRYLCLNKYKNKSITDRSESIKNETGITHASNHDVTSQEKIGKKLYEIIVQSDSRKNKTKIDESSHSTIYDRKLSRLINHWKETLDYRKLFIEFCSLMTIWLCLVKHHHTSVDIFYLVSLSTITAMSLTFLSLQLFFYNKPNAMLFYVITILFYLFLHFCNLVPLVENIWHRQHILKHQISIVFSMSIIAVCLFIYTNYKMDFQVS